MSQTASRPTYAHCCNLRRTLAAASTYNDKWHEVLVQCESNFLGIIDEGKTSSVGSGGWSNIIGKFRKAKAYCEDPFEIKHNGRRKTLVPIHDEWIGDQPNGHRDRRPRQVSLVCQDAAVAKMQASSVDAVFTDPPYFGNVQYAELMDFCYVWLRRLVKDADAPFAKSSTPQLFRHCNLLVNFYVQLNIDGELPAGLP